MIIFKWFNRGGDIMNIWESIYKKRYTDAMNMFPNPIIIQFLNDYVHRHNDIDYKKIKVFWRKDGNK